MLPQGAGQSCSPLRGHEPLSCIHLTLLQQLNFLSCLMQDFLHVSAWLPKGKRSLEESTGLHVTSFQGPITATCQPRILVMGHASKEVMDHLTQVTLGFSSRLSIRTSTQV